LRPAWVPGAVVAADIDGDNFVDIIVGTDMANEILLLRNIGKTFASAQSSGVASLATLAAASVKEF
jgi:hypothetical protein